MGYSRADMRGVAKGKKVYRSLLRSIEVVIRKEAKGQGPKANAKEAQSPKQLSPKSFNLRHSRAGGNPVL